MSRRAKAINIGLTIGSALGSAAVLYAIYPISFVLISLLVLLAHEFGHYLSALMHGGNPDLPFFIPIIFGTIGITRIRNLPKLSKRAKRYIILSGPIGGACAALSLIPFAVLWCATPTVITILIALTWEIFNGTLGADGKKWRREF